MNSAQPTSEGIDKEELQRALVDVITEALEKGEINLDQMKEASAYILEQTEQVSSPIQYIDFLQNLSQKWAIFSSVFKDYKDRVHKMNEKVVMDKLASFIGERN